MKHLRSILPLAFSVVCLSCGGGGGKSSTSNGPGGGNNPPPPPGATVAVVTYHNNLSRTGVNDQETRLTLSNVNSSQFGRKTSFHVDGQIYAQPLYVPQLQIAGGTHDVIFVATEHDSVYAFDANGSPLTPLWHVSFLDSATDTVPAFDIEGITPELGVTSTPVINLSTSTMYLVSFTRKLSNNDRPILLHAMDLATGTEKFGGPTRIRATVTGTGAEHDANNQLTLTTGCFQRSALALSQGNIYIAFGHCKHGWLVSYDAATLQQKAIFNTTPDGSGGAIWMSGGGPAVDSDGNLYVMTAVDANSFAPGYNDAFLKLSPSLLPLDDFTPSNNDYLLANDADLGSGAPMLLPDNSSAHPHLVVGGGKDGNIFSVDRDHMGGFSPDSNASVQDFYAGVRQFDNFFDTFAFWNGTMYTHAENDVLKAFSYSNGMLSTTPIANANLKYGQHGGTVSISSNGTSNGILWDLQVDAWRSGSPAILHAYDGVTMNHLYSSAQNASRDAAGPAVKFTVPTVADGRVIVGTANELDVYGLLN
jgi:hypothetical protein